MEQTFETLVLKNFPQTLQFFSMDNVRMNLF
jgi:hypothetical protein